MKGQRKKIEEFKRWKKLICFRLFKRIMKFFFLRRNDDFYWHGCENTSTTNLMGFFFIASSTNVECETMEWIHVANQIKSSEKCRCKTRNYFMETSIDFASFLCFFKHIHFLYVFQQTNWILIYFCRRKTDYVPCEKDSRVKVHDINGR